MLPKGIVIDYTWQYSRYHGDLLGYCENVSEEHQGFISLIVLFNTLESVLKNVLNDFDANFYSLIDNAFKKDLITQKEHKFLNNNKNGMRKIRNILAHSNLSKYNFKLLSEDNDLLYPFSEKINCVIFYNKISTIIFNIMLKLIKDSLIIDFIINTDNAIENFKFEIVELSPEEIMKLKGFKEEYLSEFKTMDSSTKYRLAENSSDVNILASLLKNIFDANS